MSFQTGEVSEVPGALEAVELVRRLAAGRGVLLVGQRHTPGLTDLLTRDVAAALSLEKAEDLPTQLSAVGNAARLSQLAPVFGQAAADEPLNALMENPWSLVLSSAIDPAPLWSFVQTGGAARRTQVLYPTQFVTLTRATSASPTFVPIFGSAEEGDASFRCPVTAGETARTRGLIVPRILSELPRLVGPGGVLCVVGLAADDWIPIETLLLSLEPFSDRSIHWFQPSEHSAPSDQIREKLGGRVVVWEDTFKATIERVSETPAWADLRTARTNLLRPSDRSVTILDRDGKVRPLTISAGEWRGVSRFAVLLDDSVLQQSPAATPEEDLQDFRAFLRSPQKVPDWRGIGRGYLFERAQAPDLIERVEGAVSALVRPEKARGDGPVRGGRAPILVESPPGTGKTRLLHWLAFHLKADNIAVLYLLTPNGRVAQEPVARACQMLENGGAPAVVVIADGLEIDDYRRLSEFLESVGRRAVIVGAATRAGVNTDHLDAEVETVPSGSFDILPLQPSLTEQEARRFQTYLQQRNLGELALSNLVVQERYFLLLLHQLLFDTRANIQGAIAAEYERLLTDLRGLSESLEVARPREEWQRVLQELELQLLEQQADEPLEQGGSVFAHNPELKKAVNLALFCSQIDRPIPLDLLLRVGGDALLADYAAFAETIGKTSLLSEEVIDGEGTVAVLSQHPFMARLALLNVCPDPADQVELLRPLVSLTPWNPDAFPGSNADQDFMVGVLKAIGPRGRVEFQFEAPAAREALISLLRQVREVHGADLSSLMLLEANTLRLLAKRETASVDERLDLCERALSVLSTAESLVGARKPTHARNSELRNILTTMAAVRGYQLNGLVDRSLASGVSPDKEQLFEILAEARRCTQVAQGLGPGDFYPTDVAFWAHRDPLVRAPGLSLEDQVSLLARLEELLDAVDNADISAGDVERLRVRQVELAELQGLSEVSKDLAEEMRARGNYAGVVTLLRSQVFPPDRTPPSHGRALAALERLEAYGPEVFAHDDAARLMNRLWQAAFIGVQSWSGRDPVLAECPRGEWIRWRRILEALEVFSGGEYDPHLRFCKAWASLQLEEYVRAKSELDLLRQISAGNRRRVGVLVVVTDPDGEARTFTGQVRRKDADATMVFCPTVQGEILFPRFYRFEAGDPKVGEIVTFRAGLNYQGLTPWRSDSARESDAR